jgi:hypothetical protein
LRFLGKCQHAGLPLKKVVASLAILKTARSIKQGPCLNLDDPGKKLLALTIKVITVDKD